MNQNAGIGKAHQLPALPPQGNAIVEQTIERIFAAEDSLTLIDEMLNELDAGTVGDAFPVLQLVLQSLGNFFFGLRSMQSPNFPEARDHLSVAAEGFTQTGEDELRDLSVGFAAYASAVVALQEYNVGRARELFTQVRDYLRRAGKFGQRFEWLIDHMQPENLFVQGFQALIARDFDTAKPLIEQASHAAEKLANDYYQEGTPEYFTFLGFARVYRAVYTFHRAYNDLNQFKYDSLAAEIDLKGEAVQARDLLSKGNSENPFVRVMTLLSNGYIELLDLICQLAPIINTFAKTGDEAERLNPV